MTIVYPENGKQDFSKHEDVKIIHSLGDTAPNHMGDNFIMFVISSHNCHKLNYQIRYDECLHTMTCFIDVNFDSKNLNLLIEIFREYEELWKSR